MSRSRARKRKAVDVAPAPDLRVPYDATDPIQRARLERVLAARRPAIAPAAVVAPVELARVGGVTVALHGKDRGPAERWQHMAYVDQASRKGAPTVRRVLDASPLDHYLRRGLITRHQWKAGSILRQVFRAAGIEPRVVANLLAAGGGGDYMSEAKALNMAELAEDMRAVGPVLSPVLVHVVCLEGTAGEWAELKGLRGPSAKQTGMTTLRLALDTLVHHYHLT